MMLVPHQTPLRCAAAFAPGRIGLGARRFARARRLRRDWLRLAGARLLLLRRAQPAGPGAAGATTINVGVRLAWSPSWTVTRMQVGSPAAARRVETAAVRAPVVRRRAPAGAAVPRALRRAARGLRRATAADVQRGAPVLRIVRAALSRGDEEPAPVRSAPAAPELAPPRGLRRTAVERAEPPPRAGGAGEPATGAPARVARKTLRVEERERATGGRRVVVAQPARRAEAVAAPAPAAALRPGRAAATAAAEAARGAIDVEALTADVVRRIDRRVTAWRERTGRL